MARSPAEHNLQTAASRARLPARSEPYWRQIVPGLFVGYRKGKRAAAWIARRRQGDTYLEERIGSPDDTAAADGDVVLSYAQAVARAQAVAQQERAAPAPRHYADGQTLDDVVADYFKHRALVPGGRQGRVMSAGVAKETAALWARNSAPIGAKLVTALSSDAMRKWHAGIALTPPTNRGKAMPFDPSDPEQVNARRASANRILTIAKAALQLARERGRLPSNMPDFWRNVRPFTLAGDAPPRMLTAAEVGRLLAASPDDLRELLTGALMTGARLGELTAMRVGALDPEAGRVRIVQGKTGKTLSQPLTAEGLGFFRVLAGSRPSADHMFRKADGTPWGDGHATRRVRAAAEAAGLADVSFKVTRATYGKLLLQATRDLELVARALGHSDSRITSKHYASLLPDEVAAGIASMPALGLDLGNVSTLPRREVVK